MSPFFVCSLRVPLHPGLHDGLHRDPPGGEREPGVHSSGAGAAAGGITGQCIRGHRTSLVLAMSSFGRYAIVGTFFYQRNQIVL